MKKRVFMAISLPSEAKHCLQEAIDGVAGQFEECPIRFVEAQNWHITLAFIGSVSEDEIDMLKECAAEISSFHSSLDVNIAKLAWAPENEMPPKYLWALTQESNLLDALQKDLIEKLIFKGIKIEFQKFIPHITLGKVIQWAFRRIEPTERPDVEQDINFVFKAEAIDIFESQLGKSGAKYKLIESYPLK